MLSPVFDSQGAQPEIPTTITARGIGVIYKDEKVTVTAFSTKHAMESYGYRFQTPDRTIVISGDTNPVEETIRACNGCDILLHEAQHLQLLAKMPESIQSFDAKYHTTTEQLAEIGDESQAEIARYLSYR